MSVTDSQKWNNVYSKNEYGAFPPCTVLHQNQHLLPKHGRALDLACGMGRNAIFLSRSGLETVAYDVSDVAIKKLNTYAEQERLEIQTQVCDLNQHDLVNEQFDVIVVSHYLNRELIPTIKNVLKKNGLIFYQTFTKLKTENNGPNNPDYLLEKNELLELFKEFQIVVYAEHADIGNLKEGLRNEAMLIAQKA